MTDGGGFGILATDSAVLNGFELPEFSSNAARKIQEALPPYANIKNPIDLIGDANAERYEKVLEAIMKDPHIDGVLVIALVQVPQLGENVVDVIRDSKISGKPIVACMRGGEYSIKQARRLESFGIPVYETPERAVRALAVLREYGKTVLAGQQTLIQAVEKHKAKHSAKSSHKPKHHAKHGKKKRR